MKYIRPIPLLLLLSACTAEEVDPLAWENFPPQKKVSSLQSTQFSATLETRIQDGHNAIYCPTLLYCWDEIREMAGEVTVSPEYSSLFELDRSKRHHGVLEKDEYTSEISGGLLSFTARSEFQIALPFKEEFKQYDDALSWKGKAVKAFGATKDLDEFKTQLSIPYYASDSNFIVRLQPENPEHEILLLMTPRRFENEAGYVAEMNRLITLGEDDKDPNNAWKYRIRSEDELLIPTMGFNFIHAYGDLEGSPFKMGSQNAVISKAEQIIAFVLNHQGAKARSEAEITIETAVAPNGNAAYIPPKLLHFDQPFFLMLRKKNAQSPYLAIWMETAELFY